MSSAKGYGFKNGKFWRYPIVLMANWRLESFVYIFTFFWTKHGRLCFDRKGLLRVSLHSCKHSICESKLIFIWWKQNVTYTKLNLLSNIIDFVSLIGKIAKPDSIGVWQNFDSSISITYSWILTIITLHHQKLNR